MSVRRKFYDITPPTAPVIGTAVALNETTIRIPWSAASDSGTGVNGYRIYRSTTLNGTYNLIGSVAGTVLQFDDASLSAAQTRFYKIAAIDRTPNESALSAAASATTPDVTAPSTPVLVSATATSSSAIALVWNAATDAGSGIQGYRVYRNGVALPTLVTGTTYSDTGLSASTQYNYRVDALDNANNASGLSNQLSATTSSSGGTGLTHGQATSVAAGSGFGTRSVVVDIFNDGSTNANWAGAGSPSGPLTPAQVGRGVALPHSRITHYYAKTIASGFNGQVTLGTVFNVEKPMKAFAMFKQRNDPGWVFGYAGEDNNYKFFGYSNDNGGFTLFGVYWYVDTAAFQKSSLTSAHNFTVYSSGGMGNLNHTYGPLGGSSQQSLDTWYNWVQKEFRFGLGASGQTFKSLRNNTLLHDLTGLNTDDEPDGSRSIGPTVYANSRDPVNNWVYWADINMVVGVDALKRVILSNSPTWGTPGAITEPQQILGWNNSMIEYLVNLGRLPSGGTVHEYWVDANDNPTYVGPRTAN